MEKPEPQTINEFPLHPHDQRVLLYYNVRSTRVTVVSFGTQHVLLYFDERRIKTFRLPEEVSCATVINAPSAKQGGSSSAYVLICGTTQGSILALLLPSSKDELTVLRKRNTDAAEAKADVKKESELIFKYDGLAVHSVMCIHGHLLVVVRDEEDDKLMLFQPSTLQDALHRLQYPEITVQTHVTSGASESVALQPPSVACVTNPSSPNAVLFHLSESHSSPFLISLDCVHNLEKSLYVTLFGRESETVACFFYPSGEAWFLPIGGEGRLHTAGLNKLYYLQETCAAVATVLIGTEFFANQTAINTDNSSSRTGLMLLGKNQGVFILHENVNSSGYDKSLETTYLPYSTEVKSFVSKWNNLLSCAEVFLHDISRLAPGVNVTSRWTSFVGEKQVGVKSDRVWAMQDFEDHSALISVKLGDLWDEQSFAKCSKNDGIHDLLVELEALRFDNERMKTEGEQMCNVIKALNFLASRVSETDFELLKLEISHNLVTCSDSTCLLINLAVTKTSLSSALDDFSYSLQVSVQVENAPTGHTHSFDVNALQLDSAKNLCIMVEKEQLRFGNFVTVDVFLNVTGLKTGIESFRYDVLDVLNSGFPVIVHLFSESFDVSFAV